jgi:hypothetical protein
LGATERSGVTTVGRERGIVGERCEPKALGEAGLTSASTTAELAPSVASAEPATLHGSVPAWPIGMGRHTIRQLVGW